MGYTISDSLGLFRTFLVKEYNMLGFIQIIIALLMLAGFALGVAMSIAQARIRLKINQKIIDEVRRWDNEN